MRKICVLGLGYIGLPTAAMFATHGFEVLGVDINEHVLETLNNGDVHIHEPGLKTVVQAALKSGKLTVTRSPAPADVFIIAVPTPLKREAQSSSGEDLLLRAHLSYVVAAADSIVGCLRGGNLVILESTVPPRTTVDVLVPIVERSGLCVGDLAEKHAERGAAEARLYVAHCPERVLPGRILEELVCNDRVIGGVDGPSAEMAKALYSSFVDGEMFLADATTAEMVKLMENTYRDVNIALANEFALVAERVGIDVWQAIELANHHPRVNILRPGPGVGGHCIPIDPWFVVQAAPDTTPLIRTARRTNDSMPAHVVELVKQSLVGVKRAVIACLGLAYKGEVDDIRESPAWAVVRLLTQEGYEVRVCDPHVRELPECDLELFAVRDALQGADCAVLLTNHSEFKALTPEKLAVMRGRWIVDTNACLDSGAWDQSGFEVVRLGTRHWETLPPTYGLVRR